MIRFPAVGNPAVETHIPHPQLADTRIEFKEAPAVRNRGYTDKTRLRGLKNYSHTRIEFKEAPAVRNRGYTDKTRLRGLRNYSQRGHGRAVSLQLIAVGTRLCRVLYLNSGATGIDIIS